MAHEKWSTRKPPSTGARGRGNAAEARPDADGLAALFFRKRGADERQAAGHQQGAADPLHRARGNQLLHIGREPASDRCNGEDADADREDAAPPEVVAERAAHQQQRGEQQGIRLDHPLRLERGGPQVGLDGGQCHVDDRAVDEGHAGADDGGGQHPGFGGFGAGGSCALAPCRISALSQGALPICATMTSDPSEQTPVSPSPSWGRLGWGSSQRSDPASMTAVRAPTPGPPPKGREKKSERARGRARVRARRAHAARNGRRGCRRDALRALRHRVDAACDAPRPRSAGRPWCGSRRCAAASS